GHLNVLCTDKTGTLTQNRLAVERIEPLGGYAESTVAAALAAYAAAVTTANKTLLAIRQRVGAPAASPRLVAEIPFSSAREWSAATAAAGHDAPHTLVLGSPDTLLDPADPAHGSVLTRVETLTGEGARVVLLGRAPDGLADAPAGASRIKGLEPLALV